MPPPKRNRRWLWVFAVLAVLCVLAVVIDWVRNVREPLTPEKLQEARTLWEQKRPANYDLEIVFTRMYSSADGRSGGTLVDQFKVEVRGGKITKFLVNGKEPDPLLDEKGQRRWEEERLRRENYDISGIFDSIEEFMSRDHNQHLHSYTRGIFDKNDGHVTLFTRQVNGRREQHIRVALKRVPE